MSSKNDWHPGSWKNFRVLKQATYADKRKAVAALEQITSYPGLISAGEVMRLKQELTEAGDGKKFIIQGGDCVERFIDCNETAIINKLKILLQMSLIFTYRMKRPVIRIGRIAGQYFKPRSSETESVGSTELPVYRGDGINGISPRNRENDPNRLLESYCRGAATLNYIRAVIAGGFADLHHPSNWNLYGSQELPRWKEYQHLIDRIKDSIDFMEIVTNSFSNTLGTVNFYTSHEGLHLEYEQALIRRTADRYYSSSAHMLWIGKRTLLENSAHIELFRGIDNPVGVKISPEIPVQEAARIYKTLNPGNEAGKICFITRLGAEKVEDVLPALISAVNRERLNPVWLCDPMHGNTTSTETGIKTRSFENIMKEIETTGKIHRNMKTYMAGLHFELTGEDVTECTGGSMGITPDDLNQDYRTYCDPRLNYSQAMEMAFLTSQMPE
jgi:3-deoxy-7-phosphoheptulonate synthase